MNQSISKIVPGAELDVNSLWAVLFIIATFLLASNLFIGSTCKINWIKTVSVSASFIDFLYICMLVKTTNVRSRKKYTLSDRLFGYLLLLAASMPCLVMLLCGGDYALYEILSVYIVLDGEKIIFPSACIFFITITYWMPVITINKIQNRIYKYITIKCNYVK